jgi:hypothetical protein
MPDLDLIKQVEEECMRFGRASPAILSGPVERLQPTRVIFAADLLQDQQPAR